MAVSKKGAVDASVIAGIAGSAGEGIEAGDVLCVVGAAPQVRLVGRNATQRVVTANLFDLADLLVIRATLAVSIIPQAPASGAVVMDYSLTLASGAAAPAGTSLLVGWESTPNTLAVTLDASSDPGSAVEAQAGLVVLAATLRGMVWASVGANGKVALRFAGTPTDTVNLRATQLAGVMPPLVNLGIVLP